MKELIRLGTPRLFVNITYYNPELGAKGYLREGEYAIVNTSFSHPKIFTLGLGYNSMVTTGAGHRAANCYQSQHSKMSLIDFNQRYSSQIRFQPGEG